MDLLDDSWDGLDNKNNEIILILEDIYFSYANRSILSGVNLNIHKGESLVIFGHSGTGKSTLLKLCAGIIEPSAGKVLFKDIDVHSLKRTEKLDLMTNFSFVFQDSGLINNLSIYDNLALPLKFHKNRDEDEIEEKVNFFLKEFLLDQIQNQFPASLSTGQRKLASFARTMIEEPDILFFDEPTTSVDGIAIRKLIEYIEKFLDQGGAIVTISHDKEFSDTIANKMAILNSGKIIICDDCDKVKASKDPLVKDILKSLNKNKELADEFLQIMESDDLIF